MSVKLNFSNDPKRSCSTCKFFDTENSYCEIQTSQTGNNPHPKICPPDGFVCDMWIDRDEQVVFVDTESKDAKQHNPCLSCKAKNFAGLCMIDRSFHSDCCPFQDGVQVVPLQWAIKNACDVLDLIKIDHYPVTKDEIREAIKRVVFNVKPENVF